MHVSTFHPLPRRVNGEPACASSSLLQDTLRQAWGYAGMAVSDCGAVQRIATAHHYVASVAEAAANATLSGLDMACDAEAGVDVRTRVL